MVVVLEELQTQRYYHLVQVFEMRVFDAFNRNGTINIATNSVKSMHSSSSSPPPNPFNIVFLTSSSDALMPYLEHRKLDMSIARL